MTPTMRSRSAARSVKRGGVHGAVAGALAVAVCVAGRVPAGAVDVVAPPPPAALVAGISGEQRGGKSNTTSTVITGGARRSGKSHLSNTMERVLPFRSAMGNLPLLRAYCTRGADSAATRAPAPYADGR
jgi:hypothetical protein